jgi:hypothetical protein
MNRNKRALLISTAVAIFSLLAFQAQAASEQQPPAQPGQEQATPQDEGPLAGEGALCQDLGAITQDMKEAVAAGAKPADAMTAILGKMGCSLSKEQIVQVALDAGIDPAELFPAPAAGNPTGGGTGTSLPGITTRGGGGGGGPSPS